MFEIIFLIVLSGYFIQSVLFVIGAGRTFPKRKDNDLPSVTVIVAARNEEKNILRCLTSLNKLIYPDHKLEIIIVDDRSADNTSQIIDEFISGKKIFKKIITKKEIGKLRGKTNALANALEIAAGDIILTTDADCEVKPTWAKTIACYYTPEVGMVTGFTTQEAKNSFSGMQSIDFIYLLLVGAGTININLPLSCIGNNMSYRRKAYFEVGGYENLPFSVTEDFNLLNAIYKLGNYKIIFPLDKDSLITSLPCEDFKSLYRQKKRWSVGGLGVPATGYLIMAWGFLTNLSMVLVPFFFSATALYLAFFKIATDFFVLYPIHKKLGIEKHMKFFPAYQIYYTLYVIAIPLILSLSRKVIWKGREY